MINQKHGGYTPTRFTAPKLFEHMAYSGGHYMAKKDVPVEYKHRRMVTINY